MDFVGKRNWFILLSLLVILPGIAFLAIAPGLKPGIDFTGGSSTTLAFSGEVAQDELRLELARLGYTDAVVQGMGGNTFFVRTKELDEVDKAEMLDHLREALALEPGGSVEEVGGDSLTLRFATGVTAAVLQQELATLGHPDATVEANADNVYVLRVGGLSELEMNELAADLGKVLFATVQALSFDLVSPVVAFETVRAAFWAVLGAAVGIFFYLSWAFRNVPNPFRYGAAAIIALVHDALVVIGIFAMLGKLFDVEVNTMFLIALLTVIGYSVNDTIVVFDRLKENILIYPNRSLVANANQSIAESLGRSLNTSLTLLFTLLALVLFGGPTIREFLWVLLIGVVAGTYSSIGVATQVLVVWETGGLRGLFRRSQPTAT